MLFGDYASDAIAQFNERCPVGSRVRVRLDDGSMRETTVKFPADLLGGHTPVVWLDGIPGCYRLDRVEPADARVHHGEHREPRRSA